MKFPKLVKVYCPKCKAHTDHSVSIYKGGKRRALSEGQRRYERKNLGYGSTRKPEQKRYAKVTKKQVLTYKCQKCGYTIMKHGLRVKKLELAEVIK
ncbi:50S ribosomal protein L44e [Metallosphaera tengchongensis]|uniref:Large ribosomal subunit protein eL42 n=1 Tax=Metallosphaera tengchongensis TaxID=1532350 RepID=A0A6N0NTJ5_9CREN|nr:50S ribosomal protein L44e [Metallosphaera tengchongensis]QKQ99436.1 50S ribosomal protein L44e [Metallosphaera tengchongensis]